MTNQNLNSELILSLLVPLLSKRKMVADNR